MTDKTQPETAEINRESLIEYVIFNALENDDVEFFVQDGMSVGDVIENLTPGNVDDVYDGGETVEVEGSFVAPKQVGRMPASGGGLLEPPTNPPEPILEDVEMVFYIRFTFEEFGETFGRVETA